MTEFTGGYFKDQPEGLERVHVRTSNYYALRSPEVPIDDATRTLVLLHGWGQNARSFIRKFASLRGHNILLIAPQAPHQFYLDRETRKVGFSWMTAFDRDRAIDDVVTGLDAVLERVENTLATGPLCPFVLGFSQGVSIAWRYAIHGRRKVSGLVACGGDLPPDVEAALPDRAAFPVMLVHGKDDAIVPWVKAEAAEKVLRERCFPLEANYFDGGHDIPTDLLDRLSRWIGEAR